jgi:hypothetical protein
MFIKDSYTVLYCTVRHKSTLSVEDRNSFSIPIDTELVMSSIQTQNLVSLGYWHTGNYKPWLLTVVIVIYNKAKKKMWVSGFFL